MNKATVYNIIQKFIQKHNYKDDEHVIGILFYGSYQYGLNNENSDIDLHIIYDNSDSERFFRSNEIIDGIRIEFFEKSLRQVKLDIDEGYHSQDNSAESIFGKSEIIFERNNKMQSLQNDVLELFRCGVPPLTENEAKEQIAIINNRMERVEQLAENDNISFEHLYHLTIEKIRRFYYNLNGIPRTDIYKGLLLCNDKRYQQMYAIDKIPDEEFLNIYFNLMQNNGKSKKEMYEDLKRFYEYSKRNIQFNEHDFKIPIKSRYEEQDIQIAKDTNFDDVVLEHKLIPENISSIVNEFLQEMGYLDDEHFLGVLIYGSSLTGLNTEHSDIDLHIIFDNSNPNRRNRGLKIFKGNKFEYFEKTIDEEYIMTENEFTHQNNASYSILGKGEIVYARDNSLEKLQKYVIKRYQTPMSPLSLDECKEQISIIDNKISKLERLLSEDSPYFIHIYHNVLEKMRKVHHRILGISQIPTSKVSRIYTDDVYRESTYKTNPSPEFVKRYIELSTSTYDKVEMLKDLKDFYCLVKNGIELGAEYSIPIHHKRKSCNIKRFSTNITSNDIAYIDFESNNTRSSYQAVKTMLDGLQSRDYESRENVDG